MAQRPSAVHAHLGGTRRGRSALWAVPVLCGSIGMCWAGRGDEAVFGEALLM